MAEGGLSIGTLSGQIELDDKFTATINLSNEALDELEKRFGKVNTSAVSVAEGMFTAEAAMKAVEEVAHLAAEAINEISIQGSRIADVEHNFDRLTTSAGELGEELLGNLHEGTHNTITDFELMKSVNDTMAAGVKLSSEQYKDLATGAFALAQSKGKDVSDVFTTLNDAIETGRVRSLRRMGIIIDSADAEDKFAAKLGTTADRLTAEEKQEASRIAILEAVNNVTARLGEQQDGLDEKIDQAAVRWHNFTEEISKNVATSPVVLKAFDDIENILGTAFGSDKDAAIKAIVGDIEDAAKAAVTLVQAGVDVVKFMYDYRAVIEPVGVALGVYAVASVAASTGTKAMATAIEAVEVAATPLGAIAVAAGAIYAAFELGKWQPISDFFEKLGLETFYGMSSAEADAAVATHHLTDAANEAQKAFDPLKSSQEEIRLATQNYKEVLDGIDGSVVEYGEELLKSGVSAKAVGTEYGLTAAQVRALQTDIVETTKATDAANKILESNADKLRLSREELKQYALAWDNLATIGGTFEDVINTINPAIVDSVKYYADLGAKVDDLVKAFPGLTKAQAEAAVEGTKSALEVAKVWTETDAIISKSHGDDIKDWIRLETDKYDATVKLLQMQGKATEEMLDAEHAKLIATIDAETEKRAQGIETSRASYQKQADDAKAKLDLMLADSKDFTDQDIRNAERDYVEKSRLLENWYADANDKITKGEQVQHEAIDNNKNDVHLLAGEWVTYGDIAEATLNKTTVMVKTLSGELISLEEAQKRQQAGGSYDVTSANFSDALKSFITSGGWNPGGQGVSQYQDPYTLAKKGYSFEEVLKYAFQPSSGPIPPPKGPRIPGFREGGVGDFGEGTLAVLHGKEAIVPLEGNTPPGLGGGTTNLYFNVNGTGVQVAEQIKDIIMRQLKQVRQFGAA